MKICSETTCNCATSAAKIVNFGDEVWDLLLVNAVTPENKNTEQKSAQISIGKKSKYIKIIKFSTSLERKNDFRTRTQPSKNGFETCLFQLLTQLTPTFFNTV